MNLLRTLRIGPRLAAGFGAVIVVFLIVVGSGLATQSRLAEAERWNLHTYEVLDRSNDMLRSMVNMETGARGFLLAGDEHYLEPWNQGRQSYAAAWQEARRLTADNPQQQQRLERLQALHDEFRSAVEGLIAQRRALPADGLAAFSAEFAKGADKRSMDAFRALQKEFSDTEAALLGVRKAQAQSLREINMAVVGIGTAVALLLAAGLALCITRSVVRPLNQALAAARTVAGGDLRWTTAVGGRDEVAQLLVAMRDMNASLSQVVGAVRTTSDSIATASSEIASGNADLSQRTEEQASNLQQTAASMEQLTGTVRNNADTARSAAQLASSASAAAVQGGEVVRKVVATMDEISGASKRIADIIGVIDGIAFQTNILALNAAVEAARAGEQGRGFAVVAGEVRSLAQRSAQAAREIKSLISASVETVAAGSVLVGEAGQTIGHVVAEVRRVTDLISEISSATEEQTTGIGQVGAAVSQLDQVTQQNAALVEQSAAASESLSQQARQLVEAVSRFTTATATAATTTTAAAQHEGAELPSPQALRPRPVAA